MARVIAALIRHGDYQQLPETPSAHQPFPLNLEGQAQAKIAGAELLRVIQSKGWHLSSEVDSSHLLRAWQTALIINKELCTLFSKEPELRGFDDLAERGLGSAANLTISAIEKIIRDDPRYIELPPNWKSNSHFRLPLQGAESLLEAGERVAAHINQQMSILTPQSNSIVKLFIGHGAAFRHAAHHMGVLSFEQITQLSMYHAKPIFLEYLEDNSWQHIGGEWKVRSKQSEYKD